MQSVAQVYESFALIDYHGGKVHPYNLRNALQRFERDYVRNILVLVAWDQSIAAHMLGIPLKTLEIKVKKYELAPHAFTSQTETPGDRI